MSKNLSWIDLSLTMKKPLASRSRSGKVKTNILQDVAKQEERLEAMVMSTPYATDNEGERYLLVGVVPSTFNPHKKLWQAVIIGVQRTETEWNHYHALATELERLEYRQRLAELCVEHHHEKIWSANFPSFHFFLREDPSPAFAPAQRYGTVTNFNKFTFVCTPKCRTYVRLSKKFSE